MIQSVNKFQVSDIFNPNKRIKYIVPKYQREYIWSKEDWETLFNDIYENEDSHFIGSLICVSRSESSLKINPLEVIDGQQRITTLSLLFSAIYKKLSLFNKSDEEYITEKSNLRYQLVQKEEPEPIISLSLQNKNNDDYLYILGQIGVLPESDYPLNYGNRRLSKTYQYFESRIFGFTYKETINLLKKINQTLLVMIEVSNQSDAFILFESINNTGVPLSAIDLIKNYTLAEAEKQNVLNIDDAFKKWQLIAENLNNDYNYQERFFRQFYNAYKFRKDIRIKGVNRETRSNLIKIYEKLLSKNIEGIFNELIEKSNKYRIFIKPQEYASGKIYTQSLLDLLHVEAAPAYSFLLYLFEKEQDDHIKKNIIDFLVKYFVRRNLTNFPATYELDTIFSKLVEKCELSESDNIDKIVISFLTKSEYLSEQNIFEEKLKGQLYLENTDLARFILCYLEQKNQNKETYVDLWQKNEKNKYIWTIEHIFPEGEKIPKPWVEMISNGNIEKAEKLQGELVHTLGNLTITGFNPELSNRPFLDKRNMKDRAGKKYTGYKNGLYLNKNIAKLTKWTAEDIKIRTQNLTSEAIKYFKIYN